MRGGAVLTSSTLLSLATGAAQCPPSPAPVPTSSCSSIIDLGAAAELDDATSKLFFSDSNVVAGLNLSWPAASEITSSLTSQDSLVSLCGKHGVPSELRPVCAHHLGWRACTPPPAGSNKMCVYSAALDAGLRFPLHDFYLRVLRRYHLAPSQLTPNAWSYMAAFVLLCEDAGVEPLVSAFRYFFTICGHRHKGKPSGWHHFQPYYDGTRRLFTGALPTKSGWKPKFFFLECPSGWKCPVMWDKPRREDARPVKLTDTVIEKLKQMGCIDVKLFLANREMPVGDQPALAPLQPAVKVEARVAGAGAGATEASAGAAAGATAESASSRKRSKLSPAASLSQPQPLRTSAPPGLVSIRPRSTGGCRGHIPPQQQSFGVSTSAPLGIAPARAAPSPPQSFAALAPAPRWLPRMRAQAVSIGGSGEVTPSASHTMCASDALQLWEARAKAGEQAALIAKLNEELHLTRAWNAQCQKELSAAGAKHAAESAELIAHLQVATDHNNHLKEELTRLDRTYVAERDQLIGHLRTASVEVAQLQTQHAAEKAQLKEELAAEIAQVKEEFEAKAEQLKHEGYAMGAEHMREFALAMYGDVISPDQLSIELLLDSNRPGSPVAVNQ